MRKLAQALFCIFSLCSASLAESTKTVYNPFTSNLDYITKLDTTTAINVATGTFNGPLSVTNAPTSGVSGSASQINTGDPNTKGLIVKGNTFSPTSVQPDAVSGLQGWWKADAIVGLNDNDQVVTWNDSSTNGKNATGGTNPRYKVSQINGLPAVFFNATGGTQAYKTTTISVSQPFTVFAVLNRASTAADQYWSSDSTGNYVSYTQGTNGKYTLYAGGSILAESSASSGWLIVEGVYNGASSTEYINGTSVATGNPGSSGITNFRISGASPAAWDGYIAEVIVYSGTLSSANRQGIESYLSAKYNISVAGQTAQSVNLQEWQNSSGVALSSVSASGYLTSPGIAFNGTISLSNTPTAKWLLGIDSSANLYISTGTTPAAWVKIGSQ